MRAENVGRWLLATIALFGASACYTSNEEGLGGESHFLSCTRTAQCAQLGPQWSCIDGSCRIGDAPARDREGREPAMTDHESAGAGGTGGTAVTSAAPSDKPLVILVVDTSGSMERMVDCECTTPSCDECLPDCASSQRNRFAQTLEVLTGTFDDFACEAIDRAGFDEDVYDHDYYLPYHRPSGTQRSDGLLDDYRDRLRFGLATFDGWDTWVGAAPLVAANEFDFERSEGQAGLWSYNPAREIPGFTHEGAPIGDVFYPNCETTYYMDTGIRSARAESGGLALATDDARAGEVNAEIQRSLLAVRPYGGTPIASSLDDLYHVIAQDPRMSGERAGNLLPHVVLITDGYPDDDYRTFGCDCAAHGDCPQGITGEQASAMRCPYPTPEAAARALRCGSTSGSECGAPLAAVHVVSFDVGDQVVIERLDAIAIAGGDARARIADDALELRAELNALLSELAQ